MNVADQKTIISQKKNFLKEALRNMRTTGSVWPSSRHLIEKMLSNINFAQADLIVEYGAGDGVITRELLNRMKPGGKLVTFEINEVFIKEIRKIKDDRLILVTGSAAEVDHYLKELGFKEVAYVVSGLPLSIFNKDFCDTLLSKTNKILTKKGKFIQFQYSLARYSTIKKHFTHTRIRFTALNIPPAIVYVCTK